MLRIEKLVGITLVLILFATMSVYGQARETGAIQGVISDSEGAPVPGVTVTATNTTLKGRDGTSYTDEKGRYRFPSLAPGTYQIQAELEGFQTAVRSDVRLFVGNTVDVDLSIGQSVTETIEISGETPLIDATTTASSKTVPVETIESLPKMSFALDLFTLTPGIGDRSYVAYGAGGSQANAYWFDGVDISNPVDGTYWIYPNYNWIEEVQVVGIGAPAEYGGFSGVITNTVSRSGSNEFHGLVETFFQNDSLQGNNIDVPGLEELGADTTDLFTDSTIQVSGKLVQDKLWFFTSAEYYYSRTAPFGYPPAPASESFVKVTQPRLLNKLTYKINDNNTLQGFIQWDSYELDGGSATRFTLPEATSFNEGPEWFYNASWISILSPETVLDVRYSGYDSVYDTTGRNGDIPGHNDTNTDIANTNYYGFRFRDRLRNQVNANVSYHARDFIKGNHDFKFGIEYEHSNADTVDGYNGDAYYYDGLGRNSYDPTTPNFYRTLWEGYDSFSRIRRTSFFAQDNWNITDKVNLSVGVRVDRNHAFLEEANQIEYTTTPVAPRVGIVYDVNADETTVIKAHYGHFYDKSISFYIDGIDDFGDKTYQYWYGSYWGTYDFTPGTSAYVVDPDLKQTYVQQFTVGIDKALPEGVTLSAHYIYRDFKNIAESVETNGIYEEIPFINPVTGESMTLFNRLNPEVPDSLFITNPDGLFRNYHAIEVYGGKRFGNDFILNGSVVWSRSRGNTGNSDTEADGFTNLFNDPNFNINIDGKPTHDPTWEVKVTGIYNFPWDVLGSFYYRHFTGDTFTTTFQTDRDVLSQGRVIFFAVPRGSERLDSRNVFDLRLEKAFPISTGHLKFTLDFFNLFNSGYATDVEERFDQQTFLEPESFTEPRQVRLGVRYQF
jgi:outer membrane receptor protein involved in Fe transport